MSDFSYKCTDHVEGTGTLLKESDPAFFYRIEYDLKTYQRVLTVPSTGQEVSITREIEGFIRVNPSSLLYVFHGLTDLFLVLNDGRKAGIYITDPESGRVKIKNGFNS